MQVLGFDWGYVFVVFVNLLLLNGYSRPVESG